MSKLKKQESGKLEIRLANGKSRVCKDGYDMWRFAVQNDPKMEFKFDERSGPFLSDFFERRRKK